MKVEDLELFTMVIELGGFTAAANALELPKSNVSRRINALEKDLGVALLFRTTRSLSLTPYGKAYHAEILKVLEALNRARQKTINIHNLPSGKVKIGLLPETDAEVCPVLYAFQDLNPDIELEIHTISNGFNDIAKKDLDIAFHLGDLSDSNLIAKKIMEFERVLIASPKYLEKSGCPESVDDLVKHNCLSYQFPNGTIDNPWYISGKKILINGDISSNSCGIIKRSVLAGRGIAHLPRIVCNQELTDGRLINVLPNAKPTPYTGWLLHQEVKGISYAAQLLIDFLIKNAAELSASWS